jgi:RNA methyltransferase, TrmH family
MPLRIVQSKQNPRLKELRRALTQPGRASNSDSGDSTPEGANGLLIGLEGPNLVLEALRAGITLKALFFAEGSERVYEETSRSYPQILDVESILLPRDLLNSALSTEAPQPIAALAEAPLWNWDSLSSNPAAPILVLAGIQDPGNLGAIVRSAEAFGAAGLIALPGTVSLWNPKALRASAGSAFRVPYLAAAPKEAFDYLRRTGRQIFTTAVEGAQPAAAANLTESFALIIGNEGNGVPIEIASYADSALTIPTPGAVESLNAAIAASIFLYEAARQSEAAASSSKASASKKRTLP